MSYLSQMQQVGIIHPQRFQEKYGISEESFKEIQKKAQQKNTLEAIREIKKEKEQLTINESAIINKLVETIQEQEQRFKRYKELTEQKFNTLAKEFLEMSTTIKKLQETIEKIKDKEEVTKAREFLMEYQKGDRPPLDRPIDRNGVAPKDVQITEIFNFSRRR